jgi:16S rRNA (uracil1498-N3)-methyltransferase
MRRVFVDRLAPGVLVLDAREAHHLRDVLRVQAGDSIELFDAGGRVASANVVTVSADGVRLAVGEIVATSAIASARVSVSVASAVPKNERADWLVEKLSEVGVSRWVPLQTARSVVHPAGTTKFDRWRRIAIESAKQSRRVGVMEIGELTPVESLSVDASTVVLSTRPGCVPLATLVDRQRPALLLVGPEGGWTDAELDTLRARGVVEASLTPTILRIETAAVVAAGLCTCSR